MGCSNSKVDSEETVARCRARNGFMKEAVRHRHAFAAAHAAYTQSLKNTGATLRQFGEGDARDNQPPVTPKDAFKPPPKPALFRPPPPPPLPPLAYPSSPPRVSPLPRAVSMPPISLRSAGASPDRISIRSPPTTVKEEEEDKASYVADAPPPPPPPLESPAPPPPPPPRSSQWDIFDVFNPQPTYQVNESNTSEVQEVECQSTANKRTGDANAASNSKHEKQAQEKHKEQIVQEKASKKAFTNTEEKPESANADGKERTELQIIVPPKSNRSDGKDLVVVLRDLDDLFMRAYASGKEVSRMLESRRIHYHSNFADSNEEGDHHAKVLRVMSWTRSSGNALVNEDVDGCILCEEKETHASTLDKLLAWEKKLYDEVKAGEVIRIELEKKSTQLKNQKQRDDPMTINRTKAVIKSLQTKYLVEFQAVDAASVEVQKLRDDHLYLQLVDLVEGLSKMWKDMLECHTQQYQMVGNIKFLDNIPAVEETSDFHMKNTLQLEKETNAWHQNFSKLMTTQKDYMSALNGWLRLNIIQIESEVKDKLASPQKMATPPIYHLCRAWVQALDQLPGNAGPQALKTFCSVIHNMVQNQAEELKQKKKHESLYKEFDKKNQSLIYFEKKYTERHMDQQHSDEQQDLIQGGTARNPLQERKATVDALRTKVEEEKAKHEKLCLQNRTLTIESLQTGLPPVFYAITAFARACSEAYARLHELTATGNLPLH
eukprot:c29054_g1_i1 orf=260-2413(+)